MKTMITTLCTFLLKNILVIHTGTVLAKIKSAIIIALLTSPIVFNIEKIKQWLLDSAIYFFLIFGAILLDWCIGSYVHFFKLKDFSLKENILGLVEKLFITTSGLLLFEILKAMCRIHDIEMGGYARLTMALIVLSYPSISASVNLSIASNGVFPPIGWINKMKQFQQHPDIKDLVPKTRKPVKDGH